MSNAARPPGLKVNLPQESLFVSSVGAALFALYRAKKERVASACSRPLMSAFDPLQTLALATTARKRPGEEAPGLLGLIAGPPKEPKATRGLQLPKLIGGRIRIYPLRCWRQSLIQRPTFEVACLRLRH